MGPNSRTARKRLRAVMPNRSSRLALVSLDDTEPFRAYWPLRLTQFVGGRRWSISLVRYATPTPLLTSRHRVRHGGAGA